MCLVEANTTNKLYTLTMNQLYQAFPDLHEDVVEDVGGEVEDQDDQEVGASTAGTTGVEEVETEGHVQETERHYSTESSVKISYLK